MYLSTFFDDNLKCLRGKLGNLSDNQIWEMVTPIINQCSIRKVLALKPIHNQDEIKFFWSPKESRRMTPCVVVTLGVGKDVSVESEIKKQIPDCTFIGADPMGDDNRPLYEPIGEFYNFAVGAKSGNDIASVLTDKH
ncbi:unnamed protein product [Caenorhabditis bovis]|uniref:Uncharacterized protein n=1 Tax=Caenorhabditis bovis TaxID=2654633 RepID=A0A8S1E844_9PELO|nr:unnamed protein product [Caenorhabditis bovis]